MPRNDRQPVPSGRWCSFAKISAAVVLFTAAGTTVTVLIWLFGPSVPNVDRLSSDGHRERTPLATGTVRDYRHVIGPSMSGNDIPSELILRRSGSSTVNGDRYAANHNHGNRETAGEDGVGANTAVEKLRTSVDRRKNHYGYANVPDIIDKWSTTEQQVGWTTGNHDPYDSIYNDAVGGDDGLKQSDHLAGGVNVPGTGLFDPHQSIAYNPHLGPPPPPPLSSPIVDNQPSGTNHRPPGTNHRPATKSLAKYTVPNPENNDVIMTLPGKIDLSWRTIGIMALIKLVLFKLKTVTVANVLVFLLFNVKAFLLAMYLKYQFFAKILKFIAFLVSPLFLLPLLPVLTALLSPAGLVTILSIPGQIVQTIQTVLNALANPTNASSSSSFSSNSGTSGSGNTLPSSRPTRPSAVAPNQNNIGPVDRPPRPAGELTTSSDEDSDDDDNDDDDNGRLESKSDVFHSPYRGNYEPLKMYDPTLEIFRKLLDSEKCVERIACQMAVAEKASVTPSWINWILKGVTKIVFNKNLESYLKTYDIVRRNAIVTDSLTPDSWATWCLERYDCDGAITSKSLNSTDIKT